MSRFYSARSKTAAPDSDDSSEYSSSDSDSPAVAKQQQQQQKSTNSFAMFRRADDSDSDSDSDSASDSDDDTSSARQQPQQQQQPQPKKKTYMIDSSDDSDSGSGSGSDSDEGGRKKVVKSARDKQFEELRAIVKAIRNAKKINDWVVISAEFDKLTKAYTKVAAALSREGTAPPRFYFRTLAELEDFTKDTVEKKETVKKMNSLNAKSLNAMKQKIKKYNKTCETGISAWRANPITEEQSDEELMKSSTADIDSKSAPSSEPQSASAATKANADDSDEWPSDSSDSSSSSSDSSSESDSDAPQDARSRVLRKYGKREPKKGKAEDAAKAKKTKVKKPAPVKKVAEETQGEGESKEGGAEGAGDDDGFTAVGKGGKVIEINQENFFKRFTEFWEARGKKTTDKLAQIKNFKRLYDISLTAHQKAQTLIALIASYFDYNPIFAGYMAIDLWKSTRSYIDLLLTLLEETPSIIIDEVKTDDIDMATKELKFIAGETVSIVGNIYSLIDRLDDEFNKSLQNIDPHTTEYIERLKDETSLYVLIVKSEAYFKRIGATASLDAVLMKRVEHLYYKPDQVIAVIESALPPSSQTSEPHTTLVHRLCVQLYQTENIRIRARALLCHVYHSALHGNYQEARDMLLMSHLQEQASHTDIHTQILYNRTMVQLGLCAFRCGLIRESANALQDISSSGRVKELLAQGYQSGRFAAANQAERTSEQEKMEKLRQIPFHMHINLELLECVYLTCAMLLEIPNMAKHAFEGRRKVISKPFRRMLDYSERQVFIGPPENTRDHIMAASKALSNGEWEKCRDLISAIKIWDLMLDSANIKEMLSKKIQEEGLRTYFFQYASYYESASLDHLSAMFGLSVPTAHAIISKMIINEELQASLDQATGTVVFHRSASSSSSSSSSTTTGGAAEMTKLEYLAGVYADKISTFVDNNEKLLEARSVSLGLQQQMQHHVQHHKSAYGSGVGGSSGGSGGSGGERKGGRGGSVRGGSSGRGMRKY